jgi:nucleoside-diphosphate-sugar epimerase
MFYGEDVLPEHRHLTIIKGDIRDKQLLRKSLAGHDAVIHLACISNDPSFELNPKLGKSINRDAFRPLVEISLESNVKRFIYASSSSVYGIKTDKDVHEEMSLEPLTDYSLYKAECERMLLEYQSENFTTITLRPATVCGYSHRQRLDVIVNILTNLAYHRREITVFGGEQLRPNINIRDMVESYIAVLESSKEQVAGKIFNVGFENHTVIKLAEIIRDVIGEDVKLVVTPTDDNRSYQISSKKIMEEIGFVPTYTIRQAVEGLRDAFAQGKIPNSLEGEIYFNIRRMQSVNLT